jgi:hypothetical protein
VGARLGDWDGARDGSSVNCDVLYPFMLDGSRVGDRDGAADGSRLGTELGVSVGPRDGRSVMGREVGSNVGDVVGECDGGRLGNLDGASDGPNDGCIELNKFLRVGSTEGLGEEAAEGERLGT